MTRSFTGDSLVIASHNQGKVREIAELLTDQGFEVVSAGDLGLPEPEETDDTFVANAVLKAKSGAEASGRPCLADDSGLCVAALDDAPGIYSARWAGPDRGFSVAIARVQEELGDTPDRRAHFVCVLALAWPDGHVECFEGRVDGTLATTSRGSHGFGYDPIFVPDGFDRTFGEMLPEEKNPLTHRADAFAKLVAACFAQQADRT